MNVNNEATTIARSKIFCSLVMKEGAIKRGVLMTRMNISEHTFGSEYKSWLDAYPNIKYDKETREFTYSP